MNVIIKISTISRFLDSDWHFDGVVVCPIEVLLWIVWIVDCCELLETFWRAVEVLVIAEFGCDQGCIIRSSHFISLGLF